MRSRSRPRRFGNPDYHSKAVLPVTFQSLLTLQTALRTRMPERVSVLQSNYIPWKGYFDIIHDSDLCVFYDDVQYTKNDWRNRNRIKTPLGGTWITIPAGDDLGRLICDVRLPDKRWAIKHWKTICQYYSKAAHFKRYRPFFEHIYLGMHWEFLSCLNQHLIKAIAGELLGVKTVFGDSRNYRLNGHKLDRLMELLDKCRANSYISGPAARSYIDHTRFERAGIELLFKSYAGYPDYTQFFPPFDHAVTILDLLFHVGPDAPYYIWGWRENLRKQTLAPAAF